MADWASDEVMSVQVVSANDVAASDVVASDVVASDEGASDEGASDEGCERQGVRATRNASNERRQRPKIKARARREVRGGEGHTETIGHIGGVAAQVIGEAAEAETKYGLIIFKLLNIFEQGK
eukprot:6180511-Pleurochrysis_carterae.AAC.1